MTKIFLNLMTDTPRTLAMPCTHPHTPTHTHRYAGNAMATVKSTDSIKLLSVRTTAFEKAAETGGSAVIEDAPVRYMHTQIYRSLSVVMKSRLQFVKVVHAFGHTPARTHARTHAHTRADTVRCQS